MSGGIMRAAVRLLLATLTIVAIARAAHLRSMRTSPALTTCGAAAAATIR